MKIDKKPQKSRLIFQIVLCVGLSAGFYFLCDPFPCWSEA